jgi:hypothetical protein
MSAPIIDHKVEPDASDDPSHPIPSLTVVDVMTVKKTGGADLIIVVASPLMADARSQTRLLDKLLPRLSWLQRVSGRGRGSYAWQHQYCG